ncbi:hypothetical protein AU476_01180 [Cupriavidus sp. UYMSc13B]|nr:hypothetical protein AU476_01180 [Cupriavidus sp. UYMSc13B]
MALFQCMVLMLGGYRHIPHFSPSSIARARSDCSRVQRSEISWARAGHHGELNLVAMSLTENFACVLAELFGQLLCVQLNTAYRAGEAYRWANK